MTELAIRERLVEVTKICYILTVVEAMMTVFIKINRTGHLKKVNLRWYVNHTSTNQTFKRTPTTDLSA